MKRMVLKIPQWCAEWSKRAQNIRLRHDSLGPWMNYPDIGEKCFLISWSIHLNDWCVNEIECSPNSMPFRTNFYYGLVHPTSESAFEWIKMYGQSWVEKFKYPDESWQKDTITNLDSPKENPKKQSKKQSKSKKGQKKKT